MRMPTADCLRAWMLQLLLYKSLPSGFHRTEEKALNC